MKRLSEDNTAWRRGLRRAMVARRAALAEAEHAALSARIVAHAQAALPLPAVAAFCWPIKHEPDVRALLATWAQAGVRTRLAVSKALDAAASAEAEAEGRTLAAHLDWLEAERRTRNAPPPAIN